MKIPFSILLWCMGATLIFAQEVIVSRPQKISAKITEFEFIGKTDEGLLVHKFGSRTNVIEAFDLDNLSINWYRDLNLRGKKTKVIDIIEKNNELIIIYTHQDRRDVRLFAQKLNSRLKVIKNEVLLASFKKGFGDPNFEYDVIYDKKQQHFLIQKKIKDSVGYEQIECLLIDRDLKKLGEKTFDFETNWRYVETVMRNDGLFYMVRGKVKRSFFSDGDLFSEILITECNLEKDEDRTVQLQEEKHLFNGFQSEWDALNERLVVSGFYSERQESEVHGFLYIFINFDEKEPSRKIFTPFNEEVIKKMARKGLFGSPKDHVQYVEIRKLVLRSDGGALLIGEAHSKISPNNDLRPPIFDSRMSSRNQVMVQYFYDDVLIISINPDGQMHWGEVIKKQQYSENDRGYFLSIGFMNTRENIHVLFNETMTKSSKLNDCRIDSEGEYRIRSIFDAEAYQVNLAPRYAEQLSSNEVIVPAFNQRNEFVLVKFTYE